MNREYWCDFIAGWIGGCAGLLVGHPLDTIKVRQQTLRNVGATSSFINIFKYEGGRGFYKGMGFPLLASGTLNSLFFGVYANTLRVTAEGQEKPTYSQIYLAGYAGGLVQLVVACPIDLIKIKMQMQTGSENGVWGHHQETKYRGPTACLGEIYRQGGVRGCYSGLYSMALRDVPSFGLYMVLYHKLVNHISGSEQQAGPGVVIFCGGMAGVLSWASILPLDVIKSRIQADSPTNPKYKGTWDCLMKSYRAGGLEVFTRGFLAMSLRAFPTNGAIFLAYVTSLSIIKRLVDGGEPAPATAPAPTPAPAPAPAPAQAPVPASAPILAATQDHYAQEGLVT
ncbi:hypothetical protein Pcinc_007587 [Petrolisthes cinctipes]|uniref:Solute carrier family 25 member 45 n=1 Tax=Petrolisthes cinctipes TaxID=88211 RepID=A0AAE1KY17_PETCI|nr:hypothetical protein Pcinc_007587 [Petrolisthes cinctipes]